MAKRRKARPTPETVERAKAARDELYRRLEDVADHPEVMRWEKLIRVHRNRDASVDGEIRFLVRWNDPVEQIISSASFPLTAYFGDDEYAISGLILLDYDSITDDIRARYGVRRHLPVIQTHYWRDGLAGSKVGATLYDIFTQSLQTQGMSVTEVTFRLYWSPTGAIRKRDTPPKPKAET